MQFKHVMQIGEFKAGQLVKGRQINDRHNNCTFGVFLKDKITDVRQHFNDEILFEGTIFLKNCDIQVGTLTLANGDTHIGQFRANSIEKHGVVCSRLSDGKIIYMRYFKDEKLQEISEEEFNLMSVEENQDML